MNTNYLNNIEATEKIQCKIILYDQVESAELDEMWSFVQNKSNQRWLWLAVDHNTGDILAYTFGKRKDCVFKELKTMLKPFGISVYYTDDWVRPDSVFN